MHRFSTVEVHIRVFNSVGPKAYARALKAIMERCARYARNLRMYTLLKSGVSTLEVAQQFGLSRRMVSEAKQQIAKDRRDPQK